jgi:4-alpha-glucanotransferase
MTFVFRASGILLHPTSLPGRFGIGDLGKEAYHFIDFLAASGQQVWQILPLGPTGYGNSPYLAYSAFAGNPLLINLEWLASEELLSESDLENLPDFPSDRVDFDLVMKTKIPLLEKASRNFESHATEERKQEYQEFCQTHSHWLNDYALFMALKEAHDGAGWSEWPTEIRNRRPEAIAAWQTRLADRIFFHKYVQSEFFRQWKTLKKYANENKVKIFGDIPIYVAPDSADVWSNPKIFRLNQETGQPSWMAGVPPDYFSATGQLWGNPVYNWRNLARTNFDWWIKRVETILDYVDLIRIDHFRGFESFWAVREGETTAMEGLWVKAKGREFFNLLKAKLGDLQIVAEDLGVITPEVEALRDDFDFPGMKILHFAFDSDRANPFLPFNYVNRNCIVYTGTHDNDTTVGWFEARSEEEQARVIDYLGCVCPEGIHWSLIRLAMSSVANQAIFPLQDLFGLGTQHRMNTPSVAENNWEWRYQPEMLTQEIGDHLGKLTELYGRSPF